DLASPRNVDPVLLVRARPALHGLHGHYPRVVVVDAAAVVEHDPVRERRAAGGGGRDGELVATRYVADQAITRAARLAVAIGVDPDNPTVVPVTATGGAVLAGADHGTARVAQRLGAGKADRSDQFV